MFGRWIRGALDRSTDQIRKEKRKKIGKLMSELI